MLKSKLDNQNIIKTEEIDSSLEVGSYKTIKKIDIPQNVIKELENPNLCEICFSSDLTVDTAVKFKCQHIFCLDCVKTYLHKNIENGKVRIFKAFLFIKLKKGP